MAEGGERAIAQRYAARLLADVGAAPLHPLQTPTEHPAVAWAQSGLMWLTGPADGAPLMCPAPLAACADGALAALASLAPADAFAGLRGSQLLAERAAITGARRQGAVSAGGSCRLLEAADGWIAVNLARPEDWELLPAWLEGEIPRDWNALQTVVRERTAGELEQRARLLGLAAAASRRPAGAAPWVVLPPRRGAAPPSGASRPLVVDLSSLWAGPLCAQLLRACGARVVKVESTQRPDGARRGPPGFFDLLNEGKASVALDLRSAGGRAQLARLLRAADIVVEGTRPRALRQLGIDAAQFVAAKPGMTWISITAYGRGAPEEEWVGYGDDAAIAAGLGALMHAATGRHVFAGDAIADPLTGLHAALAAWAVHGRGGGLVALALRDVVGHCLDCEAPAALPARQREWTACAGPARPPQGRAARGVARPLGADTERILADLGA